MAKISDFGLSKNCYKLGFYKTKSKGKLLPYKWLALECLRENRFTPQSDVWSFGILLWEMFTFGGEPYPGMDSVIKLIEALENDYKMGKPDNCPLEIYHLMISCWEKRPDNRPEFQTLYKSLVRLLDDSIVSFYEMLVDDIMESSSNVKGHVDRDEETLVQGTSV